MEHTRSARAVVVGGSSGIGRATAELLVESGYDVLAIARDAARLNAMREATAGDDALRLTTRAADAGDPIAIAEAFAEFGAFDHLILSPSSARGMGPISSLDLADVRAGFDGKFWPGIIALQAALPSLARGGSITFVTAISSGGAVPGTAGLAAINGALDAMIPVLAVELAPLRVNAVSPGVIDTAWWSAMPLETRQSIFEDFGAKAPAGRIGNAADVATAVAFLVANTFVTGNVLKVDGGLRFTA